MRSLKDFLFILLFLSVTAVLAVPNPQEDTSTTTSDSLTTTDSSTASESSIVPDESSSSIPESSSTKSESTTTSGSSTTTDSSSSIETTDTTTDTTTDSTDTDTTTGSTTQSTEAKVTDAPICPFGQTHDTSQGTQNLTCIPDDNKKCAGEDKVAASRPRGRNTTEDSEVVCGTDTQTDFDCNTEAGNLTLFDYKTMVEGLIVHSCRDTISYRDAKLEKYQAVVNEWKAKKGLEEDQKGQRARAGQCFLALAAGFHWNLETTSKATHMEIEAVLNFWPKDVKDPTFDIEDYMVRIDTNVRPHIIDEDRDDNYLVINSMPENITNSEAALIFKNAKEGDGEWPGLGKWLAALKKGERAISELKRNEILSKAEFSDMTTNEEYLKCLGMTDKFSNAERQLDGVPEGTMPWSRFQVTIDKSWTENKDVGEMPADMADRSIILAGGIKQDDCQKDCAHRYDVWARTYPDKYVRGDRRLKFDKCTNMPTTNGEFKPIDFLSSYFTSGGCCRLFDAENCESTEFPKIGPAIGYPPQKGKASEVGDGWGRIKKIKEGNDEISSFWCMTEC